VKSFVKYWRNFLLGKSTITAVVSTRIYEHPLPETPTFPAISFDVLAGGSVGPASTSDSNAPNLQDRYVLVRCWAADQDAARSLWGTVHDAIAGTKSLAVSDSRMCMVDQSGGEELYIDPIDGLFAVQGTYHALMEV